MKGILSGSLALVGALVLAPPARAQGDAGASPASPFFGSVPQGLATTGPVPLSLKDTVTRALQYNLGLLLQEEAATHAHGARRRALAGLLPQVSGSLSERRQVINLEAYGFPTPDPIVGPFNVFDARVGLSQAVVDLRALNDSRAAAFTEQAAANGVKSARELVVLVSVDLYLESIAAGSRVEAARAQEDTASALLRQARDLKAAGVIAGIDEVRANVQAQQAIQRRIVAANDFEKAKLRLARAIGLPPGQAFTLTDKIPYEPLTAVSLESALATAYAQRPDFLAAQNHLAAAEAGRRAATMEMMPSLRVDADYGTIGQTAATAHPTYAVAATVRVPLFEGGRAQARQVEAGAELRRRQAEVDDLRGRIDMEVRSAMLDIAAAAQFLDTAQTTVSLANQELAQARDRFAAGITGSLEVTQAQESVAAASERYIEALYRHNVAKAALARAVGTAEQAVMNFVGGLPQ